MAGSAVGVGSQKLLGGAVEAISKVTFEGQDRAKGWVGICNFLENPLEGAAKLHGSKGSSRVGGLVDATPGVINDGVRVPVTLRDHPCRGYFKVWQVMKRGVRTAQ